MSKNLNSTMPVSKIVGVVFGILSPEEIRNSSVARITSRDTYINNKPVIGGLFDPRMGVLEPGFICPTDGLDYMNTPGYSGHIELARPVFYIQFLNITLKCLRCVCFNCSKLLISKEKNKHFLNLSNEERWKKVFTLVSKVKRCGDDTNDGCGTMQPKIRKDGLATIFAEWVDSDEDKEYNDKETQIIIKVTPEMVLKIFKRISDEDVNFMGFSPIYSRPDWMVCQVLLVPPPAVRPSVKHDAQQRSEDDLTHIFANIIKTNKTLQEKIQNNAPANIIDDWTTVLQYYIATMVDNNIPNVASVAQRSGRPLKSLKSRMNGKGGRMRQNLMAKRVDFSARSVITADPNISIRELGVPMAIVKNLTKPVIVNSINKDFLTQLVRNGPDNYPGAKILEKKNGESITLRYYLDRNSILLEEGDIIHRHLMNGDAILFNRQPTLHRMSMMCHIVRVMEKGNTFRMNVADTRPYNADFDGDEMNLHAPQDLEAESELRNLAAVPYQIISPANNSSIIGIYQDSLLGSYLFSRENIRFTPRQAMNLLMLAPNVDENKLLKDMEKETGITNFDILSQIMPPLSMCYKTKAFKDDKDNFKTSNAVLEILNGKYIRGQMDKGVLGAGTKGILQRVCNDFGNMTCSKFIDDLQNIITDYMKSHAFSVGISDLISDQKTNEEIIKIITQKKTDVKNLIDQVQIGVFNNNTGKTNLEEFETQVNSILNQATSETGKVGLKSLSKNNRFVTMVQAGSKGSDLNISFMISCLGQQNVDGKRIPYGFEHRTLPHYTKYDDSPSARGFVENSYINGLSPQELFFHAMGGRVGLIDTAVKSVTWETPIVIIENGNPKYIEIGRWIDGYLDNNNNKDKVKHYTEKQMELLDLDVSENIYIPTTNSDGIVTWGEITALTRHDPGKELYEIKTSGGRNVIVTESKSLLIWNKEKKQFIETYTPQIKIGDFVPVTNELCEPPVILSYVNMTTYLSKNEFIYGTDFNKAVNMIENEMINKIHIENNWWNNHNGIDFTLPYDKKSSLTRTTIRSDISNIENNFIYPYKKLRKNTKIPDKFELNSENGTFIGLFLAEGNVNNSTITITNNNENIQNFVKKWFNKYNINFKLRSRINKIGGLTTTITGNSVVFAKFLNKFVGSGAENKYIPNEAFISNESFIIGLLNGYYSGDGTISKNSIDVGSASKRLIEGVSMLCSRLGIFGKMFKSQLKQNNLKTKNIKPTYRLSIRSNWGRIFTDKINLLEENKNLKLKEIKWTETHRNFEKFNNVVLDKIIEINFVDVKNHPKVYDLTIPSTLNFGLANGLQVRDTSTTGYIQRRLIKGLEDLKVEYDMTIRTNKNKIVQFSYGDDNIDTTKVENQEIPIVSMSNQDIYAHYLITDSSIELKALNNIFLKNVMTRHKKQQNDYKIVMETYVKLMIERRDLLIKNVFKNKSDKVVSSPVAFYYVINNIQGQCNINSSSLVDITPLEAFELIENNYNNLKKFTYSAPKDLFETLYYYYLSPKELLLVKRFNKSALILLLESINLYYKKAIVAPGEMVGMIAGQSIGEISTQMTLNSVTYDTQIIVRNIEGIIQKIQIGDFIENKIKIAKKMEYYKDKDTTYAEVDDFYEIPSCDEDGNVLWKRIEAVTRHPVINTDGTNTMLKITTEEEREVIATKAKSFLKLINGKIIPVNGDELKIGDYLPISTKQINFTEIRQFNLKQILHVTESNITNYNIPEIIDLDYNFGYLIGAYVSDGCIDNSLISISNNDAIYFEPILELCKKWNITIKISKNENKKTGHYIKTHNTLLCIILENLCGQFRHNKFISDKIIFSNKECLLGFIDAYIGGYGFINGKKKIISVSSISKELLIDVQQILNILGIYSYIKKLKQENIHQIYNLFIKNKQAQKLASILNLKLNYKIKNIKIILEHNIKFNYEINKNYLTLPNEINGKIVFDKRNDDKCKDILFNKIKNIEEVQNNTNYAYDLTISDTRNFNCYNGMAIVDTFHMAGVSTKSNVTRGVPRIEEILSLSSEIKNPSLNVYLKPEDESQREKATSIMYMLEHTKLEEIVKIIEISFDPDDLNTLIDEDRDTIRQYKEFENMVADCAGISLQNDNSEKSKWIIRMELDPEVMLEKNITMDDVNFALKNSYSEEISCIYSDFNSDKLIFRIRMNEIVKTATNKTSQKKIKVNPLDQSDQIYILKNFQEQLLQNIILRGVKGINKVILRKILDNMVEQNGIYKKQEIWVLDTIGTNLLDVLGLDYIDNTRTISNDIVEIYNVLGIEAARLAIYNELVEVVEFDGTYVNYHNYSVLVDRMTFTYKLISIFRHGINNDNIGPIAKASFEETPEMFLKAARHSELDTMKGISANVMCGQEGFYGTSAFQVLLDIQEIINNNNTEITQYKKNNIEQEIEEFFGNEIAKEDACSVNKLTIQNNVINIKAIDMGNDNNYELNF